MSSWTERWTAKRYAEGGTGPDAYDCVGIVVAVLEREFGVLEAAERPVPTSAAELHAEIGRRTGQRGPWVRVDRAEGLRVGDVLCFAHGGAHVGIYAGEGIMLHADPRAGIVATARCDRGIWTRTLMAVLRHEGIDDEAREAL